LICDDDFCRRRAGAHTFTARSRTKYVPGGALAENVNREIASAMTTLASFKVAAGSFAVVQVMGTTAPR
jgi:hypothetical protein